jgi:DHA2 family multidrug resistance protein
MATKPDALFPRELFRDRNLMGALGFFFLIGLVMLSVMALLPVLLQSIYGYPAIQAGWLLTPRGIGVLLTMRIVTRIGDRMDTRVLMAAGLAVAAWSLHMMAGWGPEMPMRLIIISGFIQGLGLGLAFTPINVLAFATLPSHLRTDAAGLMNLFRNLGASFGIAASSVLLARSIQVNHAEIAANLTHDALPIDIDSLRRFNQFGDAGFAMLDGLVNKQAVMIGYINDFHAMSIACLAAIPLVALMRRAKAPAGAPAQA